MHVYKGREDGCRTEALGVAEHVATDGLGKMDDGLRELVANVAHGLEGDLGQLRVTHRNQCAGPAVRRRRRGGKRGGGDGVVSGWEKEGV